MVSKEVRHKPEFKSAEDGLRLEILNFQKEGLYYQCSKNKGVDQLHGYLAADLCMPKAGFS